MQSFYHQSAPAAAPRGAWPSDAFVHTVIVGGGFAGLNTALGLAERGIQAVVLEQNQIGFGASGRNGGFVFGGYSLGESALIKALGAELARAWYLRTTEAVNLIRERIRHYKIECDTIDAGVLWVNWFDDPEVLLARQKLLAEQFDTHWISVDRTALGKMLKTERYSGALFERNALQVNPLKLARGLANAAQSRGAQIVEQVQVLAIDRVGNSTHGDARWCVRTNRGDLSCANVLLACGGYLAGHLAKSQPALRRALLPIATYVIATKPLGSRIVEAINTSAAVYDTRFAFDYYRATQDTRIVWGGRIHVLDAPPEKVARMLKQDMLRVFPQLKDVRVEHAWSGLMSYARHEMPQIGQSEAGLWHAQAFGGHGLAPCCVAGEAIAEAIANGDQRYLQLSRFGLSRTFGKLGLVAAQSKYWWLQSIDWWNSR